MERGVSKPENDETPSSTTQILWVELLKEAQEAYDLAKKEHQFTTALKKIQELCDKHSDSGILFGAQAQILHDICYYSSVTSYEDKKRCLDNAIYCARRSTECSPNSMLFWSFLGYLLYMNSTNAEGCIEAIETYNTALKISNPTDPQEESPISLLSPTYKERIEDLRQDILDNLEVCVSMSMELGADSSIIISKLRSLNVEIKEKVKLYWSTLSLNEKHNYLLVDIGDLTSKLAKSRNFSARTVLLDAIFFYLQHKKWECWMCCDCNESFPNFSLHCIHVVTTHLKKILSRLRKVSPVRVSDWALYIKGLQWCPLDASAVSTLLQNKLDFLLSNVNKGNIPNTVEFEYKDWPFTTDGNRMDLLSMIQDRIKELLSDNSLLAVHMDILRDRSSRKLDGYFRRLLRVFQFDGPHYCLCLLEAPQLEEMYAFLQEMSNFTTIASTAASAAASDSWRKVTGKNSIMEDNRLAFEINGEIYVCSDKLHLYLHEDSLSNTDNNASETSNSPVDNLIMWIYSDHSRDDDLKKWKYLRTIKKEHGAGELVQYEKRLQQSLRDLDEFPKEVSVGVILSDVSYLEVGHDDPGFSLRKPEVDTPSQAMIHDNNENNDPELTEIEKQILQFAVDMRQLEIILNSSAAYNYQPIVLSIVKQYIRERLERIMGSDPTDNPIHQRGRIPK